MEDNFLLKRSYQLIKKDFGLADPDQDEDGAVNFEWLLNQLQDHINYLLDHDFNKLLNALYRIDLPESTISEILSRSAPDKMGEAFAKAIIEREQQKAVTRKQYRR